MSAASVGKGLAPARAPRPIAPGERIHIIGAAGAGASAAALLAHSAGAHVTACDPGAPSPYTAALDAAGIVVAPEHDPAHVVAVAGAASRAGWTGIVSRLGVTKALTSVAPDHPELAAARAAGIAVEAWQQVVADVAATHGGTLVGVAGTHGKSTSTGWLVHALATAERDPAAFVGALMPSEGGMPPSTARWGRGDAFIVEADEYAGNFDPYRPHLAVILNAEWDHPDVFADRDAVVATFEAWVREPGWEAREMIVNVGDEGGRILAQRLADFGDRLTTVSAADAGVAAVDVRWRIVRGRVTIEGLLNGPISADLRLPGRHNASNAAAVAAAAARLGLDGPAIVRALESFEGVGRRLEVIGEPGGVLVIDDYGHHPTAIRATIAALRERHPGRRLWAVHEPLTYHRTAAMLEPLADALSTADEVVIADIWASRDPDTTITSAAALARAVATRTGHDVAAPGDPEATARHLETRVRSGDVVLVMGGGRSYVIAHDLVESLSSADHG